jgi:hypothetical protein
MAGLPWIKVWTAVRDHPKVQRLERELGIRDSLGVVVRLWCWTADYHPGGEIPESDGVTAAKAARGDACRSTPARVLEALCVAGLLDRVPGSLRVHDWEDMQTRHVEADERRRALAAERQSRYRERHGNASRNASRDGDVTQASVTEKEKEREKKKEAASSPPRIPTQAQRQRERFPHAFALLDLLADDFPDTAPVANDAQLGALDREAQRRGGAAALAEACVAFVEARGGRAPGTVAYFASVIPDLPAARDIAARTPARKPGENPKPGDPDFNDPDAWHDFDAFLARDGGTHAA